MHPKLENEEEGLPPPPQPPDSTDKGRGRPRGAWIGPRAKPSEEGKDWLNRLD